MDKKIAFLLVALLIPWIAHASNSLEISTPGTNIGISTVSPNNTLGINGGVAVGSYSYTNTTAPTNGAIIQGNVGIGSPTPGQQLDVSGTVRGTNFTAGAGGITLGGVTINSWSGSGQWASNGNNIYNSNSGNVGIGSSTPAQKLLVDGGGIAAELVNKGYEEVFPQPAALITDGQNEIQSLAVWMNKLYVGYFINSGNSGDSDHDQAPIYVTDGNTLTPYFNMGIGPSFLAPSYLYPYGGELYAGSQTGYYNTTIGDVGNDATGCIWKTNSQGTVSNLLEFPGTKFTSTTSKVTFPTTVHNQISGSTAYSVEFYGRIDDMGRGSAGNGKIFYKLNGTTAGVSFQLYSTTPAPYYANTPNYGLTVSIDEGGTTKTTTTTSTAFQIGLNHDFIFSWTSGSAPHIYVDGVEASYSSTTPVTTPSNDTSVNAVLGNNSSGTAGFSGSFRRLNIWNNYALTSSDATSLSGGGSAAQSPTGSYLFTEGTGTATADSSGNGNTATIVSPVYWNTNLMDVVYCPGDWNLTAFQAFKGNLYASSSYVKGTITKYNPITNTGTNVYTGSGGYTAVNYMFVHNGILFASIAGNLGGIKHEIVSSPDGVTWTVEASGLNASGSNFGEYLGKLMVGENVSVIDFRNDSTGTWYSVSNNLPASNLQWSLIPYNGYLLSDATQGGGAQFYKSFDGVHWTTDYTINDSTQTEPYIAANYNGSVYFGLGFTTNTSANLWRKTDSVGEQTDYINTFLNRMSKYNYNGYNYPDDPSSLAISSPVVFASNVGIGTANGSGALVVSGNVGIGTSLPNNIVDVEGSTNGGLQEILENNSTGTSADASFEVANTGYQFEKLNLDLPSPTNTGTTIGRNNNEIAFLTEQFVSTPSLAGNGRDIGVINLNPRDFYIVQGGHYATGFASTENLTLSGETGNLGLKDTLPQYSMSLGGNTAGTIGMERETTATTGGNALTINAGGGTASGAIVSINPTPTAAGTAYYYGDILNITGCGGSGGQVAVRSLTVNYSTNPVAEFKLLSPGKGYSVSTGCSTSGGHGTGATVSITAVNTSSNVNGGNLTLSSGVSVGTGTSNAYIQVYPGNVGTSTSDNSPITALTVIGSSGNVGIGSAKPRDRSWTLLVQ
jgi:hypothetical protein